MCKQYTKPADFARLKTDKLFYEIGGIDDSHRLAMLFAYMVKTSNIDEEVDFRLKRPTPSVRRNIAAGEEKYMFTHGTPEADLRQHGDDEAIYEERKKEARYQKALDKHHWHLINRFYEHKPDWYIKEIYGELGEYDCLPKHEVKWLESHNLQARGEWDKMKSIGSLIYRGYTLKPFKTTSCVCHQATPKNQVLMYHIPTKNHVVVGNECVARFLDNDLSIQLQNYMKHDLKMPSEAMIEDAVERKFIKEPFSRKGVLPFGFIRYLTEIKGMPTVDLTVEEDGRLYRLGFGKKKQQTLYELKDLSQPYSKEIVYREVGKGEKLTLFKDGDLTKVDKEDARKYIYLRGEQK